MRLLVLGSGAGGGVPQWNALNENGRAAFGRDPLVPFRSQCSLAASLDGAGWLVFNAAPDLRQQIIDNSQLHPRVAPRSSPIKGVALTGAEVDQITGLLCLRERQPFSLYASDEVLRALSMNPIFDALAPDTVTRMSVQPGRAFEPLPGLMVTGIDLPGKPPLYLEKTRHDPLKGHLGDSLAYVIEADGKRAVFAPGVSSVTDALLAACDGADAIFIDGTLYCDDEIIIAGEGQKTARRMGHLPMTGPGGITEALLNVKAARRIFIHVNNTNPAARLDSPERAALARLGWDVAEDGMEIRL